MTVIATLTAALVPSSKPTISLPVTALTSAVTAGDELVLQSGGGQGWAQGSIYASADAAVDDEVIHVTGFFPNMAGFAVGDTVDDATTDAVIAAATVPLPATAVTGPDAFSATAEVGTSNEFARADHNHGLPASAGGVAKYAATIGDGESLSIEVTHDLGTTDLVGVFVYDLTSKEQVVPDLAVTDANHVTLTFSVAPADDALRVVVAG
jgi:hypothetical protein